MIYNLSFLAKTYIAFWKPESVINNFAILDFRTKL